MEVENETSFAVLLGPLVPDDLRHRFHNASSALSRVKVVDDPQPDDIRNLLAAADLCLHAGGVSSTAECLALGTPFLVVNADGDEEENDFCRMQRYQEHGVCRMLEVQGDSDLESLRGAIRSSLGASAQPLQVTTDGAEQVAALLQRWLGEPVSKAISDQGLFTVITAPDVAQTARNRVLELAPDGWHTVDIALPPTTLTQTLSHELEMDRLHRLCALSKGFRQCLFVALTGSDPCYDELLESLMPPAKLWIVGTRDPELTRAQPAAPPPFIGTVMAVLGTQARCHELRLAEASFDTPADACFTPFTRER
jgi:hypothetical protein